MAPRLTEVFVFEKFAGLKGPNVSKPLSSFPWKDESDSERISLFKDVDLESPSDFIQVSLSFGRGEDINSRMRPDWWAIDAEVLYFGHDSGPGDFLWHHEKQFKPESKKEAEQYVDRLKKFLDSKTLEQLLADPKSGPFSLSKFNK